MNRKVSVEQLPNGNIRIYVPMVIKKKSGRKIIITPGAIDGDVKDAEKLPQEPMIQAISQSIYWCELIETNKVKSVSELARQLRMDCSFLTRQLRLSTLAPDIQDMIAFGREPDGMSLNKILAPFPSSWSEQRMHFGIDY